MSRGALFAGEVRLAACEPLDERVSACCTRGSGNQRDDDFHSGHDYCPILFVPDRPPTSRLGREAGPIGVVVDCGDDASRDSALHHGQTSRPGVTFDPSEYLSLISEKHLGS